MLGVLGYIFDRLAAGRGKSAEVEVVLVRALGRAEVAAVVVVGRWYWKSSVLVKSLEVEVLGGCW